MTTWTLLVVLGAAAVAAAVRPPLLRRRWRLQLAEAEREVAAAISDGRLAASHGEALLQHLAGLRRECSDGRREV